MKALIVYESMFGNTRVVADAIAAGMSDLVEVEVVEAAVAPDTLPSDVDLLVVGGPTHAFGLSRPGTRRTASEWRGSHSSSPEVGLREWLDVLAAVDRPLDAATFDTKVHWPPVPGSAARAALRRLRAKGCRPIGHRTFWVLSTPGPLREDEGERARRWGRDIAALANATSLAA